MHNRESTEVHGVRLIATVELVSSLDSHSIGELIYDCLHLCVHLDLGHASAFLGHLLLDEQDQLVQVHLDISMTFDRHFALAEVLRSHMELC